MGEETEPKTDDKPVTVGLIRQIVKEAIGEASSKTNEDTETRQAGRRALNSRLDRDSEIESRVEAAVKQLQDSESAKRDREETTGRLKALEEKVKDKPPVERNWAHKLMGWGE